MPEIQRPQSRSSAVKTVYHPAYRNLIAALITARRQRHLSQQSVAHALGVGRQWVSKIEHRDLRLDVLALVRLCNVYRIPASRLVRQMEDELSQEDDSLLAIRETENLQWRDWPKCRPSVVCDFGRQSCAEECVSDGGNPGDHFSSYRVEIGEILIRVQLAQAG